MNNPNIPKNDLQFNFNLKFGLFIIKSINTSITVKLLLCAKINLVYWPIFFCVFFENCKKMFAFIIGCKEKTYYIF